MATSDALITAAAAGDEDAFRQIVERHERFVRGFIFGLVADMDMADDLAQQTFIEAYRSLRTFRGDVKLTTWLCGIAHNRVRQSRRSTRRRELMLAALSFSQTDDRDPERRLLGREAKDIVMAALTRMDSGPRIAFTLKVLNEHSYDAIAEATGSSVAKLKTDVHRARAILRTALDSREP